LQNSKGYYNRFKIGGDAGAQGAPDREGNHNRGRNGEEETRRSCGRGNGRGRRAAKRFGVQKSDGTPHTKHWEQKNAEKGA